MRSEDAAFARRLAARMDELPVPEGLEERVRVAVRATVEAHAGRARRVRRRRLAVLGAAAAVLAGAGSATGFWLSGRGQEGETVPLSPAARAAVSESAVLARAPWLSQPSGSPTLSEAPPEPALAFPPGTTYAAALDRLLRSVLELGTLPRGTTLAAPLAPGVVWAPGSRGGAARLDLRAPWGYGLDGGRIRTPSFRLPASVPRDVATEVLQAFGQRRVTGAPVPAALRVDVPRLAPCQVALPGERNAICRVALRARTR